MPAYPDESFGGTISAIAPAVDPKTRTSAVHIQPQDDQSQLRPGMLATVRVVTADRPDALLIPRSAVAANATPNTPTTVVVIGPSGQITHVPVQLGVASDSVVQVSSGLGEGQVVVTGNSGGLTDGEIVQPQIQPATTALAQPPA